MTIFSGPNGSLALLAFGIAFCWLLIVADGSKDVRERRYTTGVCLVGLLIVFFAWRM